MLAALILAAASLRQRFVARRQRRANLNVRRMRRRSAFVKQMQQQHICRRALPTVLENK